MTPRRVQSPQPALWELARKQHGVVTRDQLLALGFSPEAILHRVATARLHRVWPHVYAVGRPLLDDRGQLMAAVLTCGIDACASHQSAAELWRIRPEAHAIPEVSLPSHRAPRRKGILVHRRTALGREDLTELDGIPVTSPTCVLIDLAARLRRSDLAQAVREADKLGLVTPGELRDAVERSDPRPGVGRLGKLLDEATFTLTDSELERRFLPVARAAGLPAPLTQTYVNGFRVDFFWPELGLVVETDGLRYHRTPSQQVVDLERDQAHAAAGLTALRFTYGQVAYGRSHVERTLATVTQRLRRAGRRAD